MAYHYTESGLRNVWLENGYTVRQTPYGETIAIEAWVKVKELAKGEMAYLLGKGRHGKLGADLEENNQNYAVRLKGAGGGSEVGFLFTSVDPANGGKRDWHRWWSTAQIPATGWHHVAVVYTFGKKDSLRVLIDGKATDGVWDMGGATNLGPVTDADDLVIELNVMAVE